MLCIDSFKCQQFLSDTDEHFKKVEVINFNIIHHKYRGDPLQKDLKTYQSVQKKTFLGTINRKRKILFHLPYVTNVKIFQSKRQLLTNILRACNVFFFFQIYIKMSIKYYVFYITQCTDLRKKVDPTIEIYIAKSSIAIHLTYCRDISVKFLRNLSGSFRLCLL